MKHSLPWAATLLLALPALSQGEPVTGPIQVTADNFTRAETDRYFSVAVKQGGFGKLTHHREPMSIDKQTVVRPNRDTLYSSGVFDLEAGPVTVTLPDAGKRFMSLQAIDEDHYVSSVAYGAGSHRFTREQVGTRYVIIGVRLLLDPSTPGDIDQVHALQDAITVNQAATGSFEVPSWDPVSQKTVREALWVLGSTLPDTKDMFGSREQVSPVRHLIGTATAWGGNPQKDAMYLTVTPKDDDGKTPYRLTVKDVPVDAFWSISVYNAKGYFEPNAFNAYTLNSLSAQRDSTGAVAVQFGGCDAHSSNCLPIAQGWNYMVRLYRPRAELLNASWNFPEARPIN
ncbi:DUF1254 domain-containing protein [Pseudomonas sp. NA-150]|uniref:DUF1254 domain-containing protein n=1 Tax=Pseudomonas sp. NA-150 TaxID=3367525 RepID=UPI0037C89B8E